MASRAAGRAGRAKGILVHDVVQDGLRSTRPWPVKHAPRDVATRVVAHLQAQLDAPASQIDRLAERWAVVRGIETGADAYSARVQRRLNERTRSELAARGHRTGDPILELPPGSERERPWSDHPTFLARTPEPHALLYGAIDGSNYTNLVWLRGDDRPPAEVIEALEPWREVLRTRAEFARNARRAWWETAWPRDRTILMSPKVIALYRTDRGRFALDETGAWQPSNKATIATPRAQGLSVAYLCGVLNSELLDLWYSVRGKTPRDIWRNYEPKPMNEMPYRHVPRPDDWAPSAAVDAVAAALTGGDIDAALEAAAVVRAAIGSPAADADALSAVEHLVRAVAANRTALLALRSIAPELRRAVKNPWRTHGVVVDRAAALSEMPVASVRSVRLDPELSLTITTDGILGRAGVSAGALVFTHARKPTARVEGPPARLELLAHLVGSARLMPDDLRTARMPVDLDAFFGELARRQDEIDELLDAGRQLVEAVERLVCRLYGIPDALTDLVVASAVTRSGTVAQEGD
ncbi:hypothetical protein BH20ACT16_BH20ACT16_10740 [soil metagenome]